MAFSYYGLKIEICNVVDYVSQQGPGDVAAVWFPSVLPEDLGI